MLAAGLRLGNAPRRRRRRPRRRLRRRADGRRGPRPHRRPGRRRRLDRHRQHQRGRRRARARGARYRHRGQPAGRPLRPRRDRRGRDPRRPPQGRARPGRRARLLLRPRGRRGRAAAGAAVGDAESLEDAHEALNALGVSTELDYERERAGEHLGLESSPMTKVGGQITGPGSGHQVSALVGSDGWLFLNGDSNDVLGQHLGSVVPGPDWVRGWSEVLRRRVELMAAIGAEYVHMIVPDKESVFEDMLPADLHPVVRRPVHRLLELARLRTRADLSARTVVAAALRCGLLPDDSHRTPRAAILPTSCSATHSPARARAQLVEEPAIEWTESSDLGDLGEADPPQRHTVDQGSSSGPAGADRRRQSGGGDRRRLVVESVAIRPRAASCSDPPTR